MIKYPIFFLVFFLLTGQASAQVIYERTYPNAYPSMEEAIELSDSSTVSFANNSPCYFGGWRHVSPNGDIIKEGGLANESTHSLRTRQIAKDSVLVSCRVGPLDFPGTNYFQVLLWTPDTLITLVQDTVPYYYFEDCEWCNSPVAYDAFGLHDNHVLYQRGDTVFSKNIITNTIDFHKVFAAFTLFLPLKDGLMVFEENMPPTYFNDHLEPVYSWVDPSSHSISYGTLVAFDSFLVSINFGQPTVLNTINAFNEQSFDIDLSVYFSKIDRLIVRGEILIVVGKNGAINNMLLLNRQFDILDEKVFVIPDSTNEWKLSFYPERLYAWRTDGLSGYKADYRIAYPFLDPQPITYVDLEFVDISVDSIYYWSPSPGSPIILVCNAYIVNQSADTLNSLTLHYQDTPFGMCDPGVYPRHFNNLKTPPSDTAKVKFSLGIWESDLNQPFLRTFYVQHGNHHLDSNRLDNTFLLDYFVTSAADPVSYSQTIFPNPFTNFLRVDNDSESTQLVLYDQTGRLVSKGNDHLDDLGGLPTGIYFLQINDGSYPNLQKVVKVE